ncbi:MAG: signal peptidase I [Spirochaetia bacterium]
MKHFRSRCRSVDIILWPSLFAALLLILGLSAVQVHGTSMEPVLQDRQTVFVNRFAYGLHLPSTVGYLLFWGAPAAGEVIMFEHPRGGHLSVKRSVLGPGDSIQLSGDRLYADNRSWRVTPLAASQLAGRSEIPAGYVFVVGENSSESSDSRDFGLVPISKVRGRVMTP